MENSSEILKNSDFKKIKDIKKHQSKDNPYQIKIVLTNRECVYEIFNTLMERDARYNKLSQIIGKIFEN